eukprot:9493830-Pyramimonas_sp.AAC.1
MTPEALEVSGFCLKLATLTFAPTMPTCRPPTSSSIIDDVVWGPGVARLVHGVVTDTGWETKHQRPVVLEIRPDAFCADVFRGPRLMLFSDPDQMKDAGMAPDTSQRMLLRNPDIVQLRRLGPL